jgi:hypothetical protein
VLPIKSSVESAVYPWRQLGTLLVDQQLLTPDELEQALAEQQRSGRLLGQILVDNGYLSAFSLARVLSEQHGVELRKTFGPPDEPQKQAGPPVETQAQVAWRPLGKLLVDRGFVSQTQLDEALAEQAELGGRLGEILVSRGSLSGRTLARALAEQHGVDLEPPSELDLETVLKPVTPEEPTYKVLEVVFEPGFQRKTAVHESSNFLEAVDYAFEFIEEHEPRGLEIQRLGGAAQETVWAYDAGRAAAISSARKELVDTFGFDPIRWGREH